MFAVLVCLEISIFILCVSLTLPSYPFVPLSVPTGRNAALRHPGPVPLMASAGREGVRWWVLSNTSVLFCRSKHFEERSQGVMSAQLKHSSWQGTNARYKGAAAGSGKAGFC